MTAENLRSVARNAIAMMLSQLATWASSAVLLVFLPRFLGSGDYGRLFLALSLTGIFEVVINFGGQYHLTKEIARDRARAPGLVADSLAIRAALWVASIVAMAAFSFLAGYPALVTNLVLILGMGKLWECAAWVLRWSFQGFEQMQYPSIGATIERVILTGCGMGALLLGAGPLVVAVVMAAATFAKTLYLFASFRRIVPSIPRPRWSSVRRLCRAAVPYLVWSVAAVIYYRIDAVMLSLMAPDAVVGWYGAAYRIFDILMFLPSIFTTALFPVISRLWNDSGGTFSRTAQRSLEFLVAAGLPVAILVYAFAPEVVSLLFGMSDYADSVVLLRIFAAGTLLVYVDFALGTAVLAGDKQRQWSLVALAAIVINVILNYFMIPFFQSAYANGAIGAAIATILTEFFVFLSAVALLPDRRRWMPRASLMAKGVFAGVAMAAVIRFSAPLVSFWPLSAAVGSATYLMVLWALRPLSPEEAEAAARVFNLHDLRQLFADRGRAGA